MERVHGNLAGLNVPTLCARMQSLDSVSKLTIVITPRPGIHGRKQVILWIVICGLNHLDRRCSNAYGQKGRGHAWSRLRARRKGRHLDFTHSFQTPGLRPHAGWLQRGRLAKNPTQDKMVTYMRPILGLGNVTVLADLWRTRNNHLLLAFCARQPILCQPLCVGHQYQYSLPLQEGHTSIQTCLSIQKQIERIQWSMILPPSRFNKRFFFKTALPIDLKSTTVCQAFKALEHLSSDQACCFTVGLAYANILAPQLLLHDPPKTLPFVTEMWYIP